MADAIVAGAEDPGFDHFADLDLRSSAPGVPWSIETLAAVRGIGRTQELPENMKLDTLLLPKKVFSW